MQKVQLIGFATLILGLSIMTGCGGGRPAAKSTETKAGKTTEAAKHDHGEHGPHGGTIVEWGGDYHAEFKVDHEKQEAVVYILGEDAKKPVPIKAETILLSIKEPKFQLDLKASPMENDPKGKSSRFVGKHANFAKEQEFQGTVSGVVDGKPYAGDFKEGKHEHDKEHEKQKGAAPAKGEISDREAKLFLVPGGAYTKADIEKNGNTTPAIKFKGVYFPHDDDLNVGDKICPVTKKKADPNCRWWIAGQQYEFCCYPCVEKYVKLARESPEQVKSPDTYVQK